MKYNTQRIKLFTTQCSPFCCSCLINRNVLFINVAFWRLPLRLHKQLSWFYCNTEKVKLCKVISECFCWCCVQINVSAILDTPCILDFPKNDFSETGAVTSSGGPTPSWDISRWRYLTIYIYIYMFICVCVCACVLVKQYSDQYLLRCPAISYRAKLSRKLWWHCTMAKIVVRVKK